MWHPTLVAEAVFAIANIFSSIRLISLFTANSHLGPLQVRIIIQLRFCHYVQEQYVLSILE